MINWMGGYLVSTDKKHGGPWIRSYLVLFLGGFGSRVPSGATPLMDIYLVMDQI